MYGTTCTVAVHLWNEFSNSDGEDIPTTRECLFSSATSNNGFEFSDFSDGTRYSENCIRPMATFPGWETALIQSESAGFVFPDRFVKQTIIMATGVLLAGPGKGWQSERSGRGQPEET